jgi:iron complex outermembrane receptor protein
MTSFPDARRALVLGVGVLMAVTLPAGAAQTVPLTPGADRATAHAQDLRRLSIEELASVDIITASRRPEPLLDIAAAVSVVRSDEIRRSGATSLPEAIRLADGVHAARGYGPGWAMTTRGFNIATANKMLVLIDGRTVYSPLFSGVFWDAQHLLLDDISQIEVTRGPGGSVWGANAVNGVINVITETADQTQGWLAKVAAGNELETLASVRYGGRFANHSYRVYGRFRAEDEHVFQSGAPAGDDVRMGHGGFRIDSAPGGSGRWMLQGELMHAANDLFDRSPTKVWDGHVLSRWTRTAGGGELRLQAYYEHGYRRVENQYRATRDTVDVDLQHDVRLGTRHHLVAGGAARISRGDDLGDGPGFFFDPQVRTQTIFSAFVQDEVALHPSVAVTLGGKLERNNYTDIELQPTARVRWRVAPVHTAWGAVSRSVRMPTRFDTDLRIRAAATGALLLSGNVDFKSENVVTVEGGYRAFPFKRFSVDATVFSNRYTDVRSIEAPQEFGRPLMLGNTLRARTAGVELASSAQLAEWLVLRGSYNYLWESFSLAPGSRAVSLSPGQPVEAAEANDPSHLFSFRVHSQFRPIEIDAMIHGAGRLPHPRVDAYTEMDLRLGWRVRPQWELSVVGQNLLHDRHLEFIAGTPPEMFERAVYVRSTWRY